MNELLALQGFRQAWLRNERVVLSDSKLGHMCGNAMSLNVIAAVLSSAIASFEL